MEIYNEYATALDTTLLEVRHLRVLRPLTIAHFYAVENIILHCHQGLLSYGQAEENHPVPPSSLLFLPSRQPVTLTCGATAPVAAAQVGGPFAQCYEETTLAAPGASAPHLSYVAFGAQFRGLINFFASLQIPPHVLAEAAAVQATFALLLQEHAARAPGRNRMLRHLTAQLGIYLVRHFITEGRFVDKLACRQRFFAEPRLLAMQHHIKENLAGNLSNKALAAVVGLSEDYLWQYFKMLTGCNPQAYVEIQRMEAAALALKYGRKPVQVISQEVGYVSHAYFDRRFKNHFGISPRTMRARRTLLHV